MVYPFFPLALLSTRELYKVSCVEQYSFMYLHDATMNHTDGSQRGTFHSWKKFIVLNYIYFSSKHGVQFCLQMVAFWLIESGNATISCAIFLCWTRKIWNYYKIFTKSQYYRTFILLSLDINISSIFNDHIFSLLPSFTCETTWKFYSIPGWNIFSMKYFENPNNILSIHTVCEIGVILKTSSPCYYYIILTFY